MKCPMKFCMPSPKRQAGFKASPDRLLLARPEIAPVELIVHLYGLGVWFFRDHARVHGALVTLAAVGDLAFTFRRSVLVGAHRLPSHLVAAHLLILDLTALVFLGRVRHHVLLGQALLGLEPYRGHGER